MVKCTQKEVSRKLKEGKHQLIYQAMTNLGGANPPRSILEEVLRILPEGSFWAFNSHVIVQNLLRMVVEGTATRIGDDGYKAGPHQVRRTPPPTPPKVIAEPTTKKARKIPKPDLTNYNPMSIAAYLSKLGRDGEKTIRLYLTTLKNGSSISPEEPELPELKVSPAAIALYLMQLGDIGEEAVRIFSAMKKIAELRASSPPNFDQQVKKILDQLDPEYHLQVLDPGEATSEIQTTH